MDDPDDPGSSAPDPHADAEPGSPDDRRLSPEAVVFLGLGISMAVCLALLMGAGVLVDSWLHCSPYGLVVGLALGVVTAGLMAVGTVRKYL
ncbi:MAG: AtpZ/AtpI family protein [Acidimicrobiales bacterium]|jgi:F0F1-type ATP synthase assembly protein I